MAAAAAIRRALMTLVSDDIRLLSCEATSSYRPPPSTYRTYLATHHGNGIMGNKNLSAASAATTSSTPAVAFAAASKVVGMWDASMSQSQFMARDTVLVVDANDNIIGSASKYDSHVFGHDTPRGVLHRAFSVFLFEEDADNGGGGESRLLLQKRASTKITFPNVWTNTCCSHPLHGMIPNEVDTPRDVQSGDVRGVKYAAIRKLGHELGIRAEELKVKCHYYY